MSVWSAGHQPTTAHGVLILGQAELDHVPGALEYLRARQVRPLGLRQPGHPAFRNLIDEHIEAADALERV
jgi:hypothetical protein